MKNVFLIVIFALSSLSACTNIETSSPDKSNTDFRIVKDVERNKDIARSVFLALETGDLDLLNKVFIPSGTSVIGSRMRARGGPFDSFSGAAPFPAALDQRSVKIESLFAEDDYVAVQSKICGIHARTLAGYEPTMKRLCARYTNLYTFKDGQIILNVVGSDPELRKTLEKNKLD